MNDTIVYDKAKYHYDGDFPNDLPPEQGFVHTGMYLGWIIENNLYSDFFESETKEGINDFKNRIVSGTKLYEYWDGVFVSDILNDEGNEFTQYYFDFDKGQYLIDYAQIFDKLPSLYHVQDNWKNYDKVRKQISKRYKEWKQKKEGGLFKKFFGGKFK